VTTLTDLEMLESQERALQPERFDLDSAWMLGCSIRQLCRARGVALAIEIRLGRETVFYYAMKGTSSNNADWVRRKRNTVELMEKSSYAVGLALELEGSNLQVKSGLPQRDYASHGGSFPIRLKGMGCVGVVTVSGVPQREDHAIVVEALAEMCGVPLESIALPAQ